MLQNAETLPRSVALLGAEHGGPRRPDDAALGPGDAVQRDVVAEEELPEHELLDAPGPLDAVHPLPVAAPERQLRFDFFARPRERYTTARRAREGNINIGHWWS